MVGSSAVCGLAGAVAGGSVEGVASADVSLGDGVAGDDCAGGVPIEGVAPGGVAVVDVDALGGWIVSVPVTKPRVTSVRSRWILRSSACTAEISLVISLISGP